MTPPFPVIPPPFLAFYSLQANDFLQFLLVTLEGYTAAHTTIFSRFVRCRIFPQNFVCNYSKIARNKTALCRVIPKSNHEPLENRQVKRTKIDEGIGLSRQKKRTKGWGEGKRGRGGETHFDNRRTP